MTNRVPRMAVFFLAVTANAGISGTAQAQGTEIPYAHREVVEVLRNLEALDDEISEFGRQGRAYDSGWSQLQRRADKINVTITNYNMNCTHSTTRARQCPAWEREIVAEQAAMAREHERLKREDSEVVAQHRRQRERLHDRLGAGVRALASACRTALGLERTSECFARNYSGMSNEARDIIRRHLPDEY